MFILLKFSNFVSQNIKNNNMLQHKNTTIISELSNFFTSSEKAINTILGILNSIKSLYKNFNLPKDIRAKFNSWDVVMLLILFPMLEIKNSHNYSKSTVSHLFKCGKDVFYRLKNNEIINWRSLCHRINFKMIRIAEEKSEIDNNTNSCLIIDDTDLPKTGYCIEFIGRIWSHVSNKSILGFKGLFMGYYDGKSFFCLDFSLHGEKGKNEKKPQGLDKKQAKARYSKKRNKGTAGFNRAQEYFQAKTETMKTMIRSAVKGGIKFKYILVDSWFTSESLLRFVLSLRKGCHLLCMAKMGKSRYTYKSKELTAKEIIEDQKRKKKVRKSKLLKVWYSSVKVEYKGISIMLFFCKTTHRGKWNVLLTTNTELNFEQAYKIYSTRWAIEVFFYGKHIVMQSDG